MVSARFARARVGLPAAVAIFLCIIPALSPAALAYPVSVNTFVGGSVLANVTFTPGNSSAQGPSLHLLTNATFQGATVDVTGDPIVANYTEFRTSTSDFNSGIERTHITVSGFQGTMSLTQTSGVTVFNAANNWGNGTFAGTTTASGAIVLSGASPGTYTTNLLNTSGAPWGLVYADGRSLPPSTVSFNFLDVNDTVVAGPLQSGTRVPLSISDYPSLKIQIVLGTSDLAVQPSVTTFGIGERAADFLVGGGVPHTQVAVDNLGDLVRTRPSIGALTKDPGNPLITTTAATYHSQYISQPYIITVNGTYWMYLAAGTNTGHSGAGIGRATSTDLRSWTFDAALLLSPTAASYDSYAMTHPYVLRDPEGSGYIMYYNGWTSSTAYQLIRATSPDGVTWTKAGVVLAPAGAGAESYAVGNAALVEYVSATDTYTLYYSGTGTSTGGGNSLYRTTSNDGINWARPGTQVMDRSSGQPDQDDAQGGKIAWVSGVMVYYYSCNNGGFDICLATSSTGGASWAKSYRVINRTAATFDASTTSDGDPFLAPNGTLYVYYAGHDGTSSRIGRAVAPFQAGEFTGRLDLLAAPTPDWVSFTKDVGNPIIPVQGGTYYSGYLSQPQILKMGNMWWMYLSAGQGPGFTGAKIARATSPDLVTWTMDSAPLLNSTNTTYDASALIHPYVVENPWGTGYFMYYTGVSAGGVMSIDLATSSDALNWTKVGAVLNGSGVGFDASQVSAPAYVKYNESADQLRMWYAGIDASGNTATGIAGSSNGASWTRLSTFGPNLPRGGGGSPDSNKAQGGKIIEMQGTLVFYYTCDPGSGKINTCMAQSLDGGFSWSKRGPVLNASVTGFDQTYAADPAAVLTDNQLILFYAGLGGGTSQIGVALGAFDPSAPNAWLGAPQQLPRFIAGFASNLTTGVGVTLTLQVRSSYDGNVWSNYESVSTADTMVFTQIQRYLMYRVTYSGGTGPSTFRSAQFNLTAYYESGRYRSDVMPFPTAIDRVFLDVSTGAAGHLDWYVEAGALGAVPVPPNNWVTVTGGGSSLVVRADFWGAPGATPTVQSFRLFVEADGLPADVTVRVGSVSPQRLITAGSLTGTVRFTVPGTDLAATVAALFQVNPAAAAFDVPLNFSTSHFGRLQITNLSLDYTLKNPIAATFTPAPTAISVPEMTQANFSVVATTCCGSSINYSWFLDGAVLAHATPEAAVWTPDFEDAGPHVLTCQLENGETTIIHTWTITVTNVDRPPIVVSAQPPTDPAVSYTGEAPLSVEVMDLDNDAITFIWTVDGDPWDATSNETSIFGLPSGVHNVTVEVFDGTLNATYTWMLDMTDSAPDATYTPITPLTMSHTATRVFSVSAVDPDGDPVTYRWRVAGQARPEATSAISVIAPASGTFTVQVTVTGGSASVTHDWTVTSTDNAPTAVFGPADAVSVSHGDGTEFSAEGHDLDGDAIAYSWAVDGVPIGAALADHYIYSLPPVGSHDVAVTLLAGSLSLTHHWTLTSTNTAPVVSSATPAGGKGQNTGASQTFSVQATDPDGDTMSYAWTLNGNSRQGITPSLPIPGGLAPGNYVVAVTIGDGHGGSTVANWTFVVPADSGSAATMGGSLLYILLAVAAAGAAVAFLVIRKRKQGGGGGGGGGETAPPPEAQPQPEYEAPVLDIYDPSGGRR